MTYLQCLRQSLRLLTTATVIVLIVSPVAVAAQVDPGGIGHEPGAAVQPPAQAQTAPVILENPIGIKDPRDLIGRIIGVSLGVVGSIALLVFMWGGFMWMTSVGNPERVSKGKMIILWAAIGLAVIFTSYALVSFTLNALKP